MNKAFFLDRDGIVNLEKGGYTFLPEDFEFVPGLFEGLKILIDKGFMLFVISNQSGIAKGVYTLANVETLHQIFLKKCADNKIVISEFYYCPHHPDNGLCLCRKPDSLMLEKVVARFDIDRSSSYFIGDRQRDADAAIKAGLHPILVESNTSLEAAIKNLN